MRSVRDRHSRSRPGAFAAVVTTALLLGGCGEAESADGGPPPTLGSTTPTSATPTGTLLPPTTAPPASTTTAAAPPPVTTTAAKPKPVAPPPQAAPPPPPSAQPGPHNTGYQHTGVKLTPMNCEKGELVIDKPGTVIDGKSIPCSVRVAADNVRITRSLIKTTAPYGIYKLDQYANLQVIDTEIAGSGKGCGYGIGFNRVHTIRVNIHGCNDGVHTEQGSTLEYSWIHDLEYTGLDSEEPHNDGVQSTGSSNITIRGNTISNPRHQTSCILIGGEGGAPSNVLIEGNWLDGGNYTIYLDPNGSNRTIRNNVFGKSFVYGPANVAGQLDWAGNTFADGGEVKR